MRRSSAGGRVRVVPRRRSAGRPRLRATSPAQVVVLAFAAAVAVGTVLLALPVSRAGDGGATLLEALFTATSAVCVTGLIVVDTATYWSPFGQVVILVLIQVGGFGILTLASLLGLLVSHRIGLRTRLTAAAETKTFGLGDVRTVLVGVAKVSLAVEAVTAVLVAARLATAYDVGLGAALANGGFLAVSAFNNAGFALYSDNLIGFATDAWICLPIATAVVLGGLGFPVLREVWRETRTPRTWTLHTKLTLGMTALLLVAGSVFITAVEWTNPRTLGPMSVAGKLVAGPFQGVMPRTAGFNSVDTAAMNPASWLGSDVLMFIGGGSASTAGGIKVTTFAVLLFVILAEVKGESSVRIFDRRLPRDLQRQALTIALLAVAAVVVPTLLLLVLTAFTLDQVLYEVVSAISTVGLSTGITAQLPVAGQLVLVLLMFLGRVGPITLASALALRQRHRLYELPEERPVIG